jgi:hypothetical protein
MDKHKQRMAIAEACGYKNARLLESQHVVIADCGLESLDYDKRRGFVYVVDYLNDLNAMHEAEEVLTAKQSSAYWCILQSIGKPWPEKGKGAMFWQSTHATAAQRAEAFLKTLQLWEDDK